MDFKTVIKNVLSDIYRCRIPVLIIITYMITTNIIFGYCCPYRIMFRRLCPGCGLTRAVIHIIKFEFHKATECNISVYAWLVLIGYAILVRYIFPKQRKYLLPLCTVTCVITIVQWVILKRYLMIY